MEASVQTRRMRFGAFEADLRSSELRKHGVRLKLQDQPFQVLALMLERPGDLITRDELRQRLWPADTFVDFDTGLNSAIKKLRDVLGDSAAEPRYIETIPRHGYRFIASVARAVESSSPPEPHLSLPVRENALPQPATSDVPAIQSFRFTRRNLLFCAAAALLLVGAFLRYRASHAKVAIQPAIKSIAVLPLKNLSGDSAQDYLADGMTEALIGRLAGIHDLRVISRTSSMRFKDTQLSVPEIARSLGVDAVVEGSVIRDASRIRVHAQLIRAATDDHLWAESYDREMRDVLGLQSDVAQSIARKVEVTVTGEEHARLSAARSVSPEVYESYLKGRFTLDKANTKADLDKSINELNQTIKMDSSFAPAYVGLADAYFEMSTVFIGSPPEQLRAQALAAAQEAVELDPNSAEAHVALASLKRLQWRWAESETEFKRALDLNPSNPSGYIGFSTWLLSQGRIDEALALAEHGRRLDPLAANDSDIGWILFCGHRYDEAIREYRSILALQPDDAGALWNLGFALDANQQPQEAVPVLERALSVSNRSPGIMGVLVRAYAHSGRHADALRLLGELKKRKQTGYVPAAAFVHAYLGLADYDNAFVWLEQGYQEHSNILLFIKTHPYFDPIRSDPRFKDLIRRVGLS